MIIPGLYDRVRTTVTSAPGLGPVILGPAVTSPNVYLTPSQAGIVDGTVISAVFDDGINGAEWGHYTYSGGIITRTTPLGSTNGGAPISLSANTIFFIDCLAQDLTFSASNLLFASQIQGGTGGISYWVSSTGSDSTGDGSAGNPWATLFYASTVVNRIVNDLGIFVAVAIQLYPGTYNETNTLTFDGSNNGDILVFVQSTTGIATDVIINLPNTFPIILATSSLAQGVYFNTVTLNCLNGNFITAQAGGVITLNACVLNAPCNKVFSLTDSLSTINVFGCNISGNANYLVYAPFGGLINMSGNAFVGTPVYSKWLFNLGALTQLYMDTWSGTASGPSASVSGSAVLNTDANLLSQLPGNGSVLVAPDGLIISSGGVTLGTAAVFPPCSIANLPSAATFQGVKGLVTNSSQTASGNFGAVLSSTPGANLVPVTSDGTNWIIS